MAFPRAALAVLLLAAVALAACRAGAGDPAQPTRPPGVGAPRSFVMGLSSLPPELTDDSYQRTFELAASAGEVILIQRTPPWQEMLAGTVSDASLQSTRRETQLAAANGLDLFVAIDPTDPAAGRAQLADPPDDLRGAGFADGRVRRAFTAYAVFVVENYHPAYLALGVEVNGYARQQPDDFPNFVTLYHETYEAVKQLAPDTLVFPVFQLEELQGLLPVEAPQPAQWELIELFEPRLDLLAVSSYPSLAFADPAQIPPTYYSQLTAYSRHPIAIAGMGYTSTAEQAGPTGDGEDQQAAFLRKTLDSAQQLAMPLVVWFAGQDPTYTGPPPFDRLATIGLRRQDGTAKESWTVWSAAARRPVVAAPIP